MINKKLSLPFSTIFLLALLGLPRVIAHDLRWVEPGSMFNTLLAIVPPIIWILVVLSKTNRPFMPLLWIGVVYGLLLGVTHQILWTVAFDTPPTLGGNLKDVTPLVNSMITRVFAFLSSITTGTVIGIITALIGSAINYFKPTR